MCPSTSISRTNTDLPTSSDFHSVGVADAKRCTEHNIMRCRVHIPPKPANEGGKKKKNAQRECNRSQRQRPYKQKAAEVKYIVPVGKSRRQRKASVAVARRDMCACASVAHRTLYTCPLMYARREKNPLRSEAQRPPSHRYVSVNSVCGRNASSNGRRQYRVWCSQCVCDAHSIRPM